MLDATNREKGENKTFKPFLTETASRDEIFSSRQASSTGEPRLYIVRPVGCRTHGGGHVVGDRATEVEDPGTRRGRGHVGRAAAPFRAAVRPNVGWQELTVDDKRGSGRTTKEEEN